MNTIVDAYPGTGTLPAKANMISLNPHKKLSKDTIKPKEVTNWVNLDVKPNKMSRVALTFL